VKALERREVPVAELVDALRRRQVLQPVRAEVAQIGVAGERSRRGGDEDLAAVPACGDARRAVDVSADIALVGEQRRSRMDAHPDANGTGGELFTRGRRGRQRAWCRWEGDEEGVALRVDLDPALRGDRVADHAPVLCQRLRVRLGAELVQQLRRALHVREEEAHRSPRKIRSHACSI
jgi:hypothetical protein